MYILVFSKIYRKIISLKNPLGLIIIICLTNKVSRKEKIRTKVNLLIENTNDIQPENIRNEKCICFNDTQWTACAIN